MKTQRSRIQRSLEKKIDERKGKIALNKNALKKDYIGINR